jgi:hypothetical protein
VRDILNIMHDMPSTLKGIGISARTAEAARAAKLAAWKVMLQDWRDVGPHTTVWTADRDDSDFWRLPLYTWYLNSDAVCRSTPNLIEARVCVCARAREVY